MNGLVATEPVLEVRGVWAGYDEVPVLEDVNFSVRPGDFIGIIGPNGGGKTTLLKVLLGLLKPWRGTVRILGEAARTQRHRVGYVPQQIEFDREFPVRVRDVVRMGRLSRTRLFHRYGPDDDAAVDRALGEVDLLDHAHRPLGELSGGQRQRVLIARALVADPVLLVLDEPTASVDSRVRGAVYELLRRLNATMPIVLATHDMAVISTHVKTVGCLNRRLHYHGGRELRPEVLEEVYQCPVELIAHGVPHRVLPDHGREKGGTS